MMISDEASNQGTKPVGDAALTPGAHLHKIITWLSNDVKGPPPTIIAPPPAAHNCSIFTH